MSATEQWSPFPLQILEDQLDKLLTAKDRLVCAQIDAGSCQGRRDFDRMNKRVEEYEDVKEAFNKALRDTTDALAIVTYDRNEARNSLSLLKRQIRDLLGKEPTP